MAGSAGNDVPVGGGIAALGVPGVHDLAHIGEVQQELGTELAKGVDDWEHGDRVQREFGWSLWAVWVGQKPHMVPMGAGLRAWTSASTR